VWVNGKIIKGEVVAGATGVGNIGKPVYCTTDNAEDDMTLTSTSATPIGTVIKHNSSTSCDVLTYDTRHVFETYAAGADLLGAVIANSSAHTNTTTEASFDQTVVIPAGTIRVGDVYQIAAGVNATATNSTNTLTCKLRFGGTTIATSGAIDVANSDTWVCMAQVTIRTIGASGTGKAVNLQHGPDAETTGSDAGALVDIASVDTTSAVTVDARADWSVANSTKFAR
jgi:hypothetical protein